MAEADKKNKKKQTSSSSGDNNFDYIFDHIDVDQANKNTKSKNSVLTSDFTKIEGIGPKIQELLYAEKIFDFESLAKHSPIQIKAILQKAGKRFTIHDPKTRPEQAKLASHGRRAELNALQGFLHAGKKRATENKKEDTKHINTSKKSENIVIKKNKKTITEKHQKAIKKTQKFDIDNISSYIEKTKKKQELDDKTPRSLDGKDLTNTHNIYAIVPHSKGDHKIVYLRKDAPSILLDDKKGRTKGTSYIKKGIKIYDVYVDFKEHPLLKNKKGELIDVWIIDSPNDLFLQIKAIQEGKGGGTNFKTPLIIGSWTKQISKKEKVISKKKETKTETFPTKDFLGKSTTKDFIHKTTKTIENEKPRKIDTTPLSKEIKKVENIVTKKINKKPRETNTETSNSSEETTKKIEYSKKDDLKKDKKPRKTNITETIDNTEKTKELDIEKGNKTLENKKPRDSEITNKTIETNFDKTKNTNKKINIDEIGKVSDKKSQETNKGKTDKKVIQTKANNEKRLDSLTIPEINLDDIQIDNKKEEKNLSTENTTASTIETKNSTGSISFDLDSVIDKEEIKNNEDEQIKTKKIEMETKKAELPINTKLSSKEKNIDKENYNSNIEDEKDEKEAEKKAQALKKKLKFVAKIIGVFFILVIAFVLWKIMHSTGDPTTKTTQKTKFTQDNKKILNSKKKEETKKTEIEKKTAGGINEKLGLPEKKNRKQIKSTKKDPILTTEKNIKSQYTLNELEKKIEAQQKEAKRLLKKAKFSGNKKAIKLTATVDARSSQMLEDIRNNNDITASHIQDKVEKIDLYLQSATKALNSIMR